MDTLLVAIDRHDYAHALLKIDRLKRSSKEPLFIVYINFMEPFIQYYASMPTAFSALTNAIVGITPEILQQNMGNLLHLCTGAGLNEYIADRLPKDPVVTIESFPHLCRYKLACKEYEAIDKLLVGIDKQSDRHFSKDQALRHLRWKEAFAIMVARSQLSLLTESSSAQTILTKNARTLFKLALSGFTRNFLSDFSLFSKTVSQGNTLFLRTLHRQSPLSILANLVEYDVFLVMASGINEHGTLQDYLFDLTKLEDISCEAQMDLARHSLVSETPLQRPENTALATEEGVLTSTRNSDSLLLKLHTIHPRIMVVRSLLSKLRDMANDVSPESLWNLTYTEFWGIFLSNDVADALDVCSVMSLHYRLQMDIIYLLRDGKNTARARMNASRSILTEFNSYRSVFTGKDAYISVSGIPMEILLKILYILSRTTYNNFDILPFGFVESAGEGPLLFLQRDVNAAIKHVIRTIFDAVLSGKQPLSVLIEVAKIVQDLRQTAYGFELRNLVEIIKYVWGKEAQYKENHALTVCVMYVDIVCKYTQFKWYSRRNGSLVLPSEGKIQMRDISSQNKELEIVRDDPLGSAENIQRAREAYMEPFTLKSLQVHMDTVATVVADLLYRGKDFNSVVDDTIILLTVPMLISLLNLFQNPYFHEYVLRSLDRCKTPRDKSGRLTSGQDSAKKPRQTSESQRAGSPFSALVFKRQTESGDDPALSGAGVTGTVRQVSLSNDCNRSIDRAFVALMDIANDLYGHLNEIFSQKGLADAYPAIVSNMLLLKQRMRTLNVEIWKTSLEDEVLYNFFDVANQQYQTFGSFFWRWFLERGIITQKPAHTIVSGISSLSTEDTCLLLDEAVAFEQENAKSSRSKRKPARPAGDTPLGTCKNPLCFPAQYLNSRKSARFSAVPFAFMPLIQGAAQFGREFVTIAYQSIGSSMLELVNPYYMLDSLAATARMQISSAYIFSDSLEFLYKWMNTCLGYKTVKKSNLIGLFLGLTGLLAGAGESYLRYTQHKCYIIDSFDMSCFSTCEHLFNDGGYSRDESLGALYPWSNFVPDTTLLNPSTPEFTSQKIASDARPSRIETPLPLSPSILYSNIWSYHLANQPSIAAKSLTLSPGVLASKLYVPLSRHESFSNLLNYSLRMFLQGRNAVFTRRLSRSDAIATFLVYHICSYIYLLMHGADKTVIEISNSELTTIFCDLEFLLQAKVSSDHDLANKTYTEFFDYHGFTQRLPPLDLLFNVPLLKYWLERLGALTVTLPIASEVTIRSCDLSLTIPLIILIASAIIFKEKGLMDDVQTNIDALIECISRKTVDSLVEPTKQLCLACLHNILRFHV
ncbi:CDC19 [Giardia lamblia P15]|uniref:CDC19 n=1 Tax=Giardia intestinalis (strain P15) TaxID=658858 RepID=E1EYG8_GIAIA|nr:CDC19 [Giardia lamblia P15]